MTQWYDVKISAPPELELVVTVNLWGDIRLRKYKDGSWFNERGQSTMDISGTEEYITHWMDMPEPPT